jgi:hypothetical protein
VPENEVPTFLAPQSAPQQQAPDDAQTAGSTHDHDHRPAEPEPSTAPEQNDDLPDSVKAELRKANREAQNLRQRLRAYEEAEKAAADAEKTELQRAQERAQQYEKDLAASQQQIQLLGFAAKYGIPEDDYDLLGSGTPEEMESRAVRIAHMREAAMGSQQAPSAPPSQRPLESLRPGASPTPPPVADHSYPEAWRPASWGRNEERTR